MQSSFTRNHEFLIEIKNSQTQLMDPERLRKTIEQIMPIDDEAWEASIKLFDMRTLRKKEYFLRQGEACRQIGFIHSGYVRLFYSLPDEEITKDFNTEYTFCGSYASFSSGNPSRFNIIAMEPLELQLINREHLMMLADRYMAWQKLLRLQMERMFVSKENREALFLVAGPEEKYADLMKNNPGWINRIPLKYLASYLGMTPGTLSRIRTKS